MKAFFFLLLIKKIFQYSKFLVEKIFVDYYYDSNQGSYCIMIQTREVIMIRTRAVIMIGTREVIIIRTREVIMIGTRELSVYEPERLL
jgi:hypothetical protein